MGDTLPDNFKLFDLRARYRANSFSFAAFLQDLGRAFGWATEDAGPQRPLVLLNSNAFPVAVDPVECLLTKKLKALDPYLKQPKILRESDDDEEDEGDDEEDEINIDEVRMFPSTMDTD